MVTLGLMRADCSLYDSGLMEKDSWENLGLQGVEEAPITSSNDNKSGASSTSSTSGPGS